MTYRGDGTIESIGSRTTDAAKAYIYSVKDLSRSLPWALQVRILMEDTSLLYPGLPIKSSLPGGKTGPA
jgi:hypothetical protein